MTPRPDRLPGFWRFAWLFWMQPVTLHRLLRRLDIDPGDPLWKLLRRPRSPSIDWWLIRSAQMLFLFMPALTFGIATAVQLCGADVDLFRLASGVAGGVASVVAFGVAFGVALSVASGVALGVASGVALGMGLGIVFGVAFGVVLSMAFGVALAVGGGVALGVALGGAFLASFLRIPVYLLEVVIQCLAWRWSAMAGRSTLTWSPVLYHELSYLPHPFLLIRCLLAEADSDPTTARRVLEACSIAPGQRRVGRKAEAKLRARELKRLAENEDFAAIAELRGAWLPGVQGAGGLLLSFSEAGRYLVAARAAFNPHHAVKHLDGLGLVPNFETRG